MKVSLIIPYYGDRRAQLERSLPFLENQTYPDYEVIFVDDGAKGGLPEFSTVFRYIKLREYTGKIRSPNKAIRLGFAESVGDFIIASQPELLIPYDAVERMVKIANMGRRNVATQYHLTNSQIFQLRNLPGWQQDFDKIKSVVDFASTITPWDYPNILAPTYRTHFSFSGSTRERFQEYLIPDTVEWMMEDCWVHVKELGNGELSVPVDIETYHQEHERVYGRIIEYSARIKRIREALYRG